MNLNELDEQSKSFFDLLNQPMNQKLTFEQVKKGFIGTSPFEGIRTRKTARQISNEIALESPLGKRSKFYKPEFIDKNIDFIKLSEFIIKGVDTSFDYKDFIGRESRIVSNVFSYGEDAKLDRLAGIPSKYQSKETYDAEIPLVKPSFAGDRKLQLKGKLYKEDIAIVNIGKDYQGDFTGGLEFEFDYKRRIVNYKIHFYYVGKNLVYERDNIDHIAFTVSSANYEDFYAFLEIVGRKYPNTNFETLVSNSFVKAIQSIKERVAKKHVKVYDGLDYRDLEWLYLNIPYFAAKQLDFNETIEHVFRLNLKDITRPILDFTAAITSILQKIDSQKVYDYFYNNPKKLISLYNGFSDEHLTKAFCIYLTAITFVYGKQNIEKTRKFTISDNSHIETNILYGDEKGKVELTNEMQLPYVGFNFLSFIHLYSNDPEINNPKNQSNQFHPLDIIYIQKLDENYNEIENIPFIALYGKYLGDATEWSDVTDAALAIVDVLSILVSGGALLAGIKGAARLFAILDITISTINLALLNPDLRNRLNKTEAGKWFVNHWGIISFCVSLGTISYYLAKGIVKYGKQFKTQLPNEPELAKQIEALIEESKKVEGLKEKIDDFISDFKKDNSKLSEIFFSEIITNLKGVTKQSTLVAKAAEEGLIGKKILTDEVFNSFYETITGKSAKKVSAFARNGICHFRESTSIEVFFKEFVHEGTHVIDRINNLEKNIKKLINETGNIIHEGEKMSKYIKGLNKNQLIEFRARVFEREFELALNIELDFKNIDDMIKFIKKNY